MVKKNGPKWYQMVPSGAKLCQIVLNVPKKYQIVCPIVLNGAKWFKRVPNSAPNGVKLWKHCQIGPEDVKWCQMIINDAKWCQMLPNAAKWCQMYFIKFSWFVMHFKRSSLNIFSQGLFNQRKKIPKKHWSSKNFFTGFFLLGRVEKCGPIFNSIN